MRKVITLFAILLFIFSSKVFSQTISAVTYPFTNSSGAVLEDMSSGTTLRVGPTLDDGDSSVINMGFDFWYVGVRYSQFSANTNGLFRLGSVAAGTGFTNAFTSGAAGNIFSYWDDLWSGTNGKVHYKVI